MKKKLLTILLTAVIFSSITGCGKSESVAEISETNVAQPETGTEESTEMTVENTTSEITEKTESVETSETQATPKNVVTENSSENIANKNFQEEDEITQNQSSEEVIEMVDWITWATQPDNDDIVLVVWNEKNKTQKKLSNGEKYIIQTGDKLAIPRRTTIMTIHVGKQDVYFNADGYAEIAVEGNDWVEVDILYKVEDGTGEYGDNKEYSIYEYFLKNE